MRDIKFRVWDRKTKKMRQLASIVFGDDGHIKLVNAWGYDIIEDKDIIVRRENQYVLNQYSGLMDKNGKEIYEGDIYHQGDPNITYTVVWNDSGLIGKQNGSNSYAGLLHWQDRIEVIGNIYEGTHSLEQS